MLPLRNSTQCGLNVVSEGCSRPERSNFVTALTGNDRSDSRRMGGTPDIHTCRLSTPDVASAIELDAFHREHAKVELAIRDLKESAGMEHVPSGQFFAYSAWLCCAVSPMISCVGVQSSVTSPKIQSSP